MNQTSSSDVHVLPISDCQAALERPISTLKSGEALRPVTVIGPLIYANLSMRHFLAGTGFANIRFLVMPSPSELLGAPALSYGPAPSRSNIGRPGCPGYIGRSIRSRTWSSNTKSLFTHPGRDCIRHGPVICCPLRGRTLRIRDRDDLV